MIQNLRAFEIYMIHPTTTKGSRVKIKDLRHKKSKTINYSYEFNSCKDEGEKYLKSLNIPCLYACETEKGFIILSDNFDIMLK